MQKAGDWILSYSDDKILAGLLTVRCMAKCDTPEKKQKSPASLLSFYQYIRKVQDRLFTELAPDDFACFTAGLPL